MPTKTIHNNTAEKWEKSNHAKTRAVCAVSTFCFILSRYLILHLSYKLNMRAVTRERHCSVEQNARTRDHACGIDAIPEHAAAHGARRHVVKPSAVCELISLGQRLGDTVQTHHPESPRAAARA